MDAALWELLEEGEGQDEVAAIIRLGQPGVAPSGVRLIAEFGNIATCRLKRGDIIPTREAETVASFKAPRILGPEPEVDEQLIADLSESDVFVDERRPLDETATGRGCIVGVVDWGCDFAHPDFRNADGSTRLLALWDQRLNQTRKPPASYGYGVVHTREDINRALAASNPYQALGYHPADADTGQGSHGTHVLGIAAGNGRGGGPSGVAPEADLVFVHSATLAQEGPDRLGDSVTLLEAVDFIKNIAGDRPWVINLSMGKHGEQHDGTTLVEQGLDQILSAAPGRAIVQSTGNYFDRRIHSCGQLRPSERRELIWEIEEVDPTPNQLEVWYPGPDTFEVDITGPQESVRQKAALGQQTAINFAGREVGRIYHRRAEPNNLQNHVEVFLYRGAPAGRWTVGLKGADVVDGRYHAWIERDAACPRCQSRFAETDAVSASTTGTICNGFRSIAVGAYNPHSDRHELAFFSSSGPTRDGRVKPDLLAPGVRILAARSAPHEATAQASLLTRMSGTSMASPYVAGTVALMFEAAGRPLRIEETHNLLLANTQKVHSPGEDLARVGSGYCDISKAVEAARSAGGTSHALKVSTNREAIMDSPFEHALGEITEDDAGKETAATAFETQEDFEREYDGLNFARQENDEILSDTEAAIDASIWKSEGADRTGSLPLILAGPIVRRATPERVWFWFACSKEPKGCQPSITAYDEKGHVWQHLVDPTFKEIVLVVEEDRVARLGENIWVVLCSAVPSSGKFPTDIILGYDLLIHTQENGENKSTKLADLGLDITYAPFARPTFVIGKLNRVIAQGSCRRPGASGEDASNKFDEWLATTAADAFKRPASLILTGDQIYADDVAVPLFAAVHKIAKDVFGYVEQMPNASGGGVTSVDSYSWKNTVPVPGAGAGSRAPIPSETDLWSGRKKLTHRRTSPFHFTTDDGEAHLLSFPEYAAMYLAVWNPEICKSYGVDDGSDKNLKGFDRAVKAFRRVMANTATYMLCDDHEITDDWNLDQEWEDATKKNPMARRIIANGLAAYWGFQAWGNDPDMFDKNFVQVLSLYFEQLRSSGGYPRNVGSRSPYNAAGKYDELLLNTHWSFMAPSNPQALCVDTRTRRETPTGKTAILSGQRVWPFMESLLRKHNFRRGDTLLLVLPTPFLPHRSMMYIQHHEFNWPDQRYEGEYELYGNNPQQRAELILRLQHDFGPSALIIFSGDVHHGSVVTGRYGYGSSLDKIKNGKADWAMRVVQITSSPIKNVKSEAYEKKRWWTVWQTDAGNAGESLIPQWETQYASTTANTFIAMQAFMRQLKGELGRKTYIFENHFCVATLPAQPGGSVDILFAGVKNGKLATASISVDTDNDPAKFQIQKIMGIELPMGVNFPGFEMVDEQFTQPLTTGIYDPHEALEDTVEWQPQERTDFRESQAAPTHEAQLVETADEVIGSAGRVRVSHRAMLGETLERVAGANPLKPTGEFAVSLSPSSLFETFAHGKHPDARQHLEQFFEVVALPRSPLTSVRQGDILLRHPLGEGGFTHAAILANGEIFRGEELSSVGLRPESSARGYYAKVVETGAFPHGLQDHFARRVGDESGRLTHDSLILRVRHRSGNSFRSLPENLEGQETQQYTPALVALPNVLTRLEGIDIYEKNTGFPSFADIARAGFSFVFHKASQFIIDTKLATRWPQIAQAGMIRGVYHLLSHNAGSVAIQAQRFATAVGRLVPGDLGPSLDLEDRDPAHRANFWLPRIQEFADLMEARLGRQPIFYTSRSYWQEFANDDPSFGNYPLWVVWVNPGAPRLPAGWTNWNFQQWHWEQSTTPMPPPFLSPRDKGVDLNHFNGTIYQLRGMADLGHTAPHLVGNQECVAYSEPNGKVHLLELVAGTWRDQDLSTIIPSAPPAAGDPTAIGIGSDQVILYRTATGDIQALTRSVTNVSAPWSVFSTGPNAIDDPVITVIQNDLHAVYWNQFNRQIHLFRQGGTWHAEQAADLGANPRPPLASGSAVAYLHQNAIRFVARGGDDGHLIDHAPGPGGGVAIDLTATARDGAGHSPPAATYRPATYTPAGKAPRVVFRAVRGDIWQIERDTLLAKNLGLSAGHVAPAAGSPTAIVTNQAHVFYRTGDGTIIDIFEDAGAWRSRNVCSDAAADPTAYVDSGGHAAISFRARDGSIQIARFVNSAWQCENATRPQTTREHESIVDDISVSSTEQVPGFDMGCLQAALEAVTEEQIVDLLRGPRGTGGNRASSQGLYFQYNIPDSAGTSGTNSWRSWEQHRSGDGVGGGWFLRRRRDGNWLDFYRSPTDRPGHGHPLVWSLIQGLRRDPHITTIVLEQYQRACSQYALARRLVNPPEECVDLSLALVAAYRQFGDQMFSASTDEINSFGDGGLDDIGRGLPGTAGPTRPDVREGHGTLPFMLNRGYIGHETFTHIRPELTTRWENENENDHHGHEVIPAMIRRNEIFEIYTAVLNWNRDSIYSRLRAGGIYPAEFDSRARRIWTRAAISTIGKVRDAISAWRRYSAEDANNVRGNDRLLDVNLAGTHAFRKGHVSAAEAEVLDRLVFSRARACRATAGHHSNLSHESDQAVTTPETLEEQVSVDDVASEMNGLRARFLSMYPATRADSSTRLFSDGALLPIDEWNGTNAEAVVAGFNIPKIILDPAPDSVTGMRRYEVALHSQRNAIGLNATQLTHWVSRESEFSRNHASWERERTRLETLLHRRQVTYSRMWVRQMMYNRFDVDISHWVDHYNAQLHPASLLDPNIVKSMIYQETRMGTSGAHLMPPPSDWSSSDRHPIRSRFNLGQAIDSWGPQQFLMIQEMAPPIYTANGLSAFERTWYGMSNSDYASSAPFMRALREFFEFRDGSNHNLMGTSGRDLHEDYGFWIRTAIRWLFVKYSHLGTPTWAEAVRAYNGGGHRARAYRDAVMGRVGSTDPFPAESLESTLNEVAGEDFGELWSEDDAPPSVAAGRHDDEIIVTRADGTRYHVRRKVRVQVLTRPGLPRVGFCADDERVYGRASWCEGTQGTIDVGANLPAAARQLLDTLSDQIARKERPEEIARTLENAQVQTFVQLAITKDRNWAFTGDFKLDLKPSGIISKSAAVSFDKGWVSVGVKYEDDGTGKQVRVTVDIPLGARTVSGKKCQEQEVALWWDAECLREVPTTGTIQSRLFRSVDETLYLYFEHATDILRRDPKANTEPVDVFDKILRSSPKLGTALLNKRTLQRLDYLVGQGYWLDSVKGYTSPEGRRGPPGPRAVGAAAKWEGNDKLSEERAKKVRDLIEARYLRRSLQMRDLLPLPPRMRFPSGKSMPSEVGKSEYPMLDVSPGVELEGPKLDRVMIRGGVKFKCSERDPEVHKQAADTADKPFLEQCPKELPRMTEDDRKYVTDSHRSDRDRAERLFENLRRVEIHLRHEEKLRDVDVPDTRLEHEHNCPPDVIDAAERKWGSRIPFVKPDPPLCG